MIANYGDVIPRRDFEMLEQKFNVSFFKIIIFLFGAIRYRQVDAAGVANKHMHIKYQKRTESSKLDQLLIELNFKLSFLLEYLDYIVFLKKYFKTTFSHCIETYPGVLSCRAYELICRQNDDI